MTPARVRFIEDQEVSDPYGDLKVIVGTQNKKASILVSSAVFRDASSKLKAMISAAYGDTSPLVVQGEGMACLRLYDNAEAMVFVCHILHRNREMAGHSTDGIGFLSNLAQVVERYELSKALLPQSYFWMENLKGQADFAPEVLWFAFAFGHAEAFCYATKDLMNHYSGTRFADKYVWGRHISPPEGLFDAINTGRRRVVNELKEQVIWTLDTEREHNCTRKQHHRDQDVHGMWTDCVLCPYEDEHVCITKAEYLGAKNDGTCDHCIQCLYYAHELKDAGIGIADYDTADEQTSEPALYLLKLKKIEVYDADGVTLELHEPSSAGKTIDLASQLRSIIESHVASQKGICLTCVKHGRTSREQGNCLASKEDYCTGHGELFEIHHAKEDGEDFRGRSRQVHKLTIRN